MSTDDKKKKNTIHTPTSFKIAGLETEESAQRVNQALKKMHSAHQNSHLALLDLIDFLIGRFGEEIIEPVAKELPNIADSQYVEHLLGEYKNKITKANSVLKQAAEVENEFPRALCNCPPEK